MKDNRLFLRSDAAARDILFGILHLLPTLVERFKGDWASVVVAHFE